VAARASPWGIGDAELPHAAVPEGAAVRRVRRQAAWRGRPVLNGPAVAVRRQHLEPLGSSSPAGTVPLHRRPTGGCSMTDEPAACPRCGAKMVLQFASRGSNAGNCFWGCSRFPQCRGSRAIDGGVGKEASARPRTPKASRPARSSDTSRCAGATCWYPAPTRSGPGNSSARTAAVWSLSTSTPPDSNRASALVTPFPGKASGDSPCHPRCGFSG
jgi:hypothetical protein